MQRIGFRLERLEANVCKGTLLEVSGCGWLGPRIGAASGGQRVRGDLTATNDICRKSGPRPELYSA